MHLLDVLRDINNALPTISDFLVGGSKLGLTLLLLLLGWWFLNKRTTEFDDHEEIVSRRNTNFTLLRVGALFGQLAATMGLTGVLPHGDTQGDLLWLACGGLFIIALFDGIRALLQKLLAGRARKSMPGNTSGYRVSKRQNANALRKISTADAIMQSTFYIAYGLVIAGAFTGAAPSIATALQSTALFLIVGILTLVSVYLAVGRLYGLKSAVRAGNVAAALILGSVMLGLGFVLQTAIEGDFYGFAAGLVGFAVYALFGIVLLLVLLPILDMVFLRRCSIKNMIEDNNWQAAGVLGSVMLGTAIVLSNIQLN